jgi:hypothetical protein
MAALAQTHNAIESRLNLNDEGSALSRLRAEMIDKVNAIARGNSEFHVEMRAALADLHARK